MRSLNCLILVISSFTIATLADDVGWHKYTSNEMAWDACSLLITATGTFCAKTLSTEECYCSNVPALGTIAHCYVDHFDNSTTKINYFLKKCKKIGNTTLTADEFYRSYNNATDFLIIPANTTGFNRTLIGYSPLVVTESNVERYYTTNSRRWMNYNRGIYYGIAMFCYWFAVMFAAAVANWSIYLFPSLHKRFNGPISKGYKKYISLPSTGRKTHSDISKFLFFEWLSPTRLETIIVSGFCIMAIITQAVGYVHTPNNSTWPQGREAEISRLVADRTGISSLFLFPLVILFSGRNNFMQWITGWSFSRMMVFHKWISRVAVALIFVHGIGMTLNGIGLGPGRLMGRMVLPYYQMGIVSVVAGCVICFQSLLFFRKRCYEVFLIIHFVLAAVCIAGGWNHTADEGWQTFYYPCIALWGFDRVVRVLRLLWFGAPLATLELKGDETVRVTVKKPASWKYHPGSHAYVHFFCRPCFWQSHPFTIIEGSEENTIVFCSKVKGGVTQGLHNFLLKQPNHTAQIRVSAEGPYGSREPLDKFDNTVFIAGGNGVPGLYMQAIDLATRQMDRQRIKLYWVFREWHSIDWFYQELKKLGETKVDTTVYVTRPESKSTLLFDSDASSSEIVIGNSPDSITNIEKISKKSETNEKTLDDEFLIKLKDSFPGIEFREGRPELGNIVKEELETAIGSTAVVTCAHPSMVDEIRYQVAHNIQNCAHNVELFEELQVW